MLTKKIFFKNFKQKLKIPTLKNLEFLISEENEILRSLSKIIKINLIKEFS